MMTHMITEMSPDALHRGVKMALDNGEADSIEAAYALFASYRMTVGLGAGSGQSLAVQAALLTMVNCGRRALLGGVEVVGDLNVPLLVDLPGLGETLGEAIVNLGGEPRGEPSPQTPLAWLGDGAPAGALQVTFGDWRGGVFVAGEGERLTEGANDIPAAVLAGALAVAEVFQRLRGNPMAGDRDVGLSLWDPRAPWRGASGPVEWVAPTKLWVLGLPPARQRDRACRPRPSRCVPPERSHRTKPCALHTVMLRPEAPHHHRHRVLLS